MKKVVINLPPPTDVVELSRVTLDKTYLVTFKGARYLGYIQTLKYDVNNGFWVRAFLGLTKANGWDNYTREDTTLYDYIKFLISVGATVMEFDKEMDALEYAVKVGLK